MDVVTAVLTPVVQALLVPVKKHLGFLVSSSSKVEDMLAEVPKLNDDAVDMRTQQELSNQGRIVVPERVSHWLEDVKTINAKAEKIPKDRVGCFSLKARYKAGRDSSDITKKIGLLMEEKKKMVPWPKDIIPLGMVSPPRPSTSPTVCADIDQYKERIASRSSIFSDALTFLEPSNTKTQKMALCGMPGVGKTTMMKDLKTIANDKKMFDYIVEVVVGQNPDLSTIQQVLAMQTGSSLTEPTKETRAEHLRKRLEKMLKEDKKKILVILDDVWKKFDLKDIGLASPLPDGIKLVLTSREESVCNLMDVEPSLIFKIEVLKDTEAKSLFWHTIGVVDIEPSLHEIAEQILKRCGGLPIAINVIASTLKCKKEKDEWEDTLSRLQDTSLDVNTTKEIFKICYENLKDGDLKAIFLLSGLFPEDSNIVKEELLRYGWGLKFFGKVSTIAAARKRVNACVNELISSNLLIKSDHEGCVMIHDLVREFLLSDFVKLKQASIVNLSELTENESYDRILLSCRYKFEFPVDFCQPDLALLKLIGGYEEIKFPDDFYPNMENLEVVAYEYMCQPLLPGYSSNLRVLVLHSCSLVANDISFLGDLIKLEVLSLRDCGIEKLPSEIGKLERLKLLDLTGCADLFFDDGVFQNLKKLEELYMRLSKKSKNTIRFTDASYKELNRLLKKLSALEIEFFMNMAPLVNISFEKLERFRISMGCRLESSDEHSFKNTLRLATSTNKLLDSNINLLFRKTETLHLTVNDMSSLKLILVQDLHDPFCNLKALSISDCASLTYLFSIPVAKSLMVLESLQIWSCDVLKSVVRGENSEPHVIKFPKLKTMSLYNLPQLVSLCDDPVDVLELELPLMVRLSLYELPNVTSIFPKNNIDISAKQPFLNKKVVIPKLDKLKLDTMMKLKEIWPCEEEVNNISTLRKIGVNECNSLVNIFPSNPMRLLSNFKKLKLAGCDSIEELFTIDLGKIKQLSNHSSLKDIVVWSCASFRYVWRIKEAENNYPGLCFSGFQDIETIYIFGCKRFRNIFTPTTVTFDMRALQDLCIHECGGYGERNNQLVKNGQEINTMSKEETSIAFPSNQIIYNFHQLRVFKFDNFKGVEVVFEIQSPINRDDKSVTTQQPLLLLPYLEQLFLYNMDSLTHVWKCNNWNEFFILHKHQPQLSSFENLTTIDLYECKSIKYLFSPLMAKLLSNLKKVEIRNCKNMEEIVSNRDDEERMAPTSTNTTASWFPHLDELCLFKLDNLKHIGGAGIVNGTTNVNQFQSKFSQLDDLYWSLCQNSRKITIHDCNALSSVFPYYAAGSMQKLQELRISHCSNSTAVAIPRPAISTMHELSYLKEMSISHCKRLEYIFTFSTFQTARQLEMLFVRYCEGMEVIVREGYGMHTTTSSKDVVFPRLRSIYLIGLPKLKGFFLGMNIDFQWPVLNHVVIKECPQMKVFTSGWSTAPGLKYISTELGKHNPEGVFHITPMLHQVVQTPSTSSHGISFLPTISKARCLSFHNLTECILESDWEHTYIFPSSELQHLQKLETVHATNSYAHEVFEVALENESPTVVKFPKLREVDLNELDYLKYIWKSNQWRTLEFPNLSRLSIGYCKSSEHVFTCSMVGCVMQLQELHIENCEKMKVIVKKDEEEDCDAKVSEIKFPCLKSLKLKYLWDLEGFCLGNDDFTFPSLETLVIKDCPELMVFTAGSLVAPMLTEVDTSFGSFDVGEDINSFITIKKQEGYKFG